MPNLVPVGGWNRVLQMHLRRSDIYLRLPPGWGPRAGGPLAPTTETDDLVQQSGSPGHH
jgi:hypothetical protein